LQDTLGGEFDPRIYSYGHRNIQGVAFTRDGQPFLGVSVEHGPAVDDEVNQLTLGGNFGWDPVPGYNESVPMTDKTQFPDAVEAVWSSGSPTLAPSGASFIYGDEWGQYDGVLLVAMLKTQHIRAIAFDQNGNITGEEEWFKEEYGRFRSVFQASDGSVYLTTDNGGGRDVVLRVVPD
jgi:glucose/arabinose dehydrogenase